MKITVKVLRGVSCFTFGEVEMDSTVKVSKEALAESLFTGIQKSSQSPAMIGSVMRCILEDGDRTEIVDFQNGVRISGVKAA